ncbi:hypothetical protein Lgra_3413 [Legionella gratiana]|uniref:Uncharacterized protein n=1 Tax=Legionella gratiana TaxID=45066 RepID=A0A378JEN4_9GAMM|nr:hypothetical protein [Legionella gratiana]KTD05449.1 hypothetical protein Lgra_3413 [Legionella gratiana]STX46075.1 Uncharacterised protein [Legionella gratiana]
MKDSIITLYKSELEKHYLDNNGSMVSYLIEKMSTVTTIEELMKLFSNVIQSDRTHYEAISLSSKLSTWKKELENLKSAQQQTLVDLGKITITSKNKNLLLLLKEILSDSHLLLHSYMPLLLSILCNNSLSDLIDYIVQLPSASKSIHSLPRFFAAPIPRSEQHAECLFLLNNLMSAYREKDRLWETTKGLLQTSLIMYQELEFLEVNLNDEKDTQNIERSCCSLM